MKSTWAVMAALAAVMARGAPAEAPKQAEEGLTARLVMKETTFTIPAGQRGAAFRDTLKNRTPDQPPLPAPPVLNAELELKNNSPKPVTFMFGSDQSRVDLKLEGPGAASAPAMLMMTMEFRLGKPVTIPPGGTYRIPIAKLCWGMRGVETNGYWTEPGEYTLTASYQWVPEANADGGAFNIVRAPPVKLTVKE